jgi:hypothetical protein
MSSVELGFAGKALLLKINVITGWAIPEENMDILIEIFTKKLIIGYPNVNADEFEYAFISGSSNVKDWGKAINLNLIDEVMQPYLQKRFELSRIEEQQKNKMLELPKESLTDQTMNDWFNDVWANVKNGTLKMEFMPLPLYEWYKASGKIVMPKGYKSDLYVRATAMRQAQLAKDVEDKDDRYTREAMEAFMDMRRNGVFEGQEVERIKNIAKKIYLYELMQSTEI